MSNIKIGEYIHASYRNYREYGLSKKTPQSVNISNIIKNQTQAIKDRARSKFKNRDIIKQDLEEKLNFFYRVSDNRKEQLIQLGVTEEDLKEIQNAMFDAAKKAAKITEDQVVSKQLNVFDANTVSSDAARKNLADNKIRKIQNTSQYHLVKTFEKRINALKNALNEISMSNATAIDRSAISKLNQIFKDFEQLKNEVKSNGANLTPYTRIQHNKGGSKLEKEINELWTMIKGTALSKTKGDLAEHMAVLSVEIATELAEGHTKDLLQDIVSYNGKGKFAQHRGKETSIRALKKENFAITGFKNKNIDLFLEFGKIELEASPKEEKVDATFIVNKQPINASIKNYNANDKFGIHILSGTSIFKRTQDYPEFMNHYLNTATKNSTENKGITQAPSSIVKSFNNLLYKTIVLHALIGDEWSIDSNKQGRSTSKADIFVVNDNSGTGGFKVYFMDDIIDNLLRSTGTDDMYHIHDMTLTKRWNNEMEPSLSNDKTRYQAAYRRILKLLKQLHEQSLSVSISPKVLTK